MIQHPLITTNPTWGELRYVAENLRAADRDEVDAASGMTPLGALRRGRIVSSECYTLWSPKGNPAAILGVVPIPGRGGSVWLLGTDDIQRHALAFHRGLKPQWERMARRWGYLANMVDARNKVHIRWLEWLGCTFLPPAPCGRHRLPFIPFFKVPNV